MAVTEAMIVAGGQGTRLRPLTYTVPKPLLYFCGRPFLEGVMDRLAEAGVTRLWLVVGRETAEFEDTLGPAADDLGITLRCVPEPEPLDTAGGVRAVVDEVGGAFFVLNGDVLTDVPFADVAAAHEASGADATIVLTRVEDTSTFGVCVRDGSRITSFVEKPAPGTLPGQDAINAGTYVLEPHVFDPFPQGRLSFERQVFPGLLDGGGHIEGFVHEGVWADLGTPDRYREGTAAALAGAIAWPPVLAVPERAPGVRVHPDAEVDPSATLTAPVLVLAGASVGAGARVGPETVVGARSHVGVGAALVGAVLLDDVEVGDGVAARGLLAGNRARIASGATLGADVVLGDEAEVVAGESLPDGARRPDPAG